MKVFGIAFLKFFENNFFKSTSEVYVFVFGITFSFLKFNVINNYKYKIMLLSLYFILKLKLVVLK